VSQAKNEAGAPGAEASAPFFSIVIPTYNRAGTIPRAVGSCLAQTFGDFEVIVVDDGSQDDTGRVVGAIGDGRIRYLRTANAGAAAARNTGAAAAAGSYLCFLDSDDEFLPGKLRAFHDAIFGAGDEAAGTVWYSQLLFSRGEGVRSIKPERAIRAGEGVGDYLFAYDGLMQTSTLVLSKDLFARVRFDPTLRNLQDLDLCLRLEQAGARFRMLPEPQAVWHDESAGDRISGSTGAAQVAQWAESRRALLSDRAYRGFLARFLALRLMRTQPATAVGLLWRGVSAGALSPFRAVSILVRGAAPATYSRVRDWLMRRRIGQSG
jgi:glycosyltransferase involved in cell wall biosynthesis